MITPRPLRVVPPLSRGDKGGCCKIKIKIKIKYKVKYYGTTIIKQGDRKRLASAA